jgi:hypothetical protein
MARRALPALLVAAAALFDVGGLPDLALYALLAAIAALALAVLAALGEVIDGDRPAAAHQLQALLSGIALLLVVGGAAVSAPAARTGEFPALADSALFTCLVVLALEAAVGAARAAVERPARPRRAAPPAEELREAA